MKEEYENDGAEKDNEFVVEFESESITIDVPWSGIAVEGGWKLSPLTEPTVRCTAKHNYLQTACHSTINYRKLPLVCALFLTNLIFLNLVSIPINIYM